MPRVSEIQRFQVQDLILKVKIDEKSARWDEARYENFLSVLCEDREYQKEAIKTALHYILDGYYPDLRALAEENWNINDILRERYKTWSNFERYLQLPDKLAASIDLATGTGKSYVMYGIAAILLAEGVVDSVLVLCPSTTIENELLKKFHILAGDTDLRELLPPDAIIRTPRIMSARDETITPGCICVENRDAVYEHVKSTSIKDSLYGKGTRVAVLNDETHHVANEVDEKKNRWKEFLENPEYGFRIVLGFSGTCYVRDDYFADVIYRYSLRDAMEQRFVKTVRYIAEEPTTGERDERWQLVYSKHQEIRRELQRRGIRPLTIVVTPNIRTCQNVGEELREFLVDRGKLSEEEVEDCVLTVYNNAPDVPKLKTVDNQDSNVEWIVSVSMLNEGWDVKRVFQIVPHEERAFNSKLLIAQVLGRGLRIPDGWEDTQPEVTVFNHAAWSASIQHLVNEILENETKISSKVVPDSPYNFDLHHLRYKVMPRSEKRGEVNSSDLFPDEKIDLPSEAEDISVSVDFERATTREREAWKTVIQRKVHTAEDVANAMFNSLERLDFENSQFPNPSEHTHYHKDYPYEKLLRVVRNSLNGDEKCSEGNKQRLLRELNKLRKNTGEVLRFDLDPDELVIVNTTDRPMESASAAQLKHDKIAFITDNTRASLDEEEIEFFDVMKEPDSGFRKYPVSNDKYFNTPLNLVVAESEPERVFLREIVKEDNAEHIDCWIKSTSKGFYSIDYILKKGRIPRDRKFNPDIFIKIKNMVIVLEIKDDEELRNPSLENIWKNQYTIAYFERLNRKLREREIDVRYHFHFIAQSDVPEFFTRVQDGTIASYRSKLDFKLKEAFSNL